MPKVYSVEDFPYFAEISATSRRLVSAIAKTRSYVAGEAVFEQGETVDSIYLLLSGAVRVISTNNAGKQALLKLFTAPATFGEVNAMTAGISYITVQAVQDSEIAAIPVAVFESLLAESPKLSRLLVRELCQRMRNSFLARRYEDVESRLASVVLGYCSAFGTEKPEGVQLPSRLLGYQALADCTASAPKSVQRTFDAWRDQGLLKKAPRVYFVDVDALRAVAGEGGALLHHTMTLDDLPAPKKLNS